MKRLAWTCFVVFWAAVATLLAAGRLAPDPEPQPQPQPGQTSMRVIGAEELAQHDSAEDCWMAIRGKVYELTRYIPEHPTRPGIMLRWCGQEATEAYETKGFGRPHSAMADAALDRYLVGQYE